MTDTTYEELQGTLDAIAANYDAEGQVVLMLGLLEHLARTEPVKFTAAWALMLQDSITFSVEETGVQHFQEVLRAALNQTILVESPPAQLSSLEN